MKKLLFLAIIIITAKAACAQVTETRDSLFIVTYSLGPAWDAAKPPQEQSYFKEHSANLSKWRKEGQIKLGARYADKGMVVFTAKSTHAIRDLIYSDPAVINKLFIADVQKLSVFYDGCISNAK
jgi:hypothetical protein